MKTVPAFCIYLDVLGFNQLTEEAFSAGEGDQLLEDFHTAIDGQVGLLKKRSNEDRWEHFRVKTFTDNIIISHPVTSWDAEDDIGDLISDLVEFNLRMAVAGFFIRGGWTVDLLYMEDDIVFGPAILKAYKIETEKARVPRIALDETVTEFLKKHLNFYANPADSPQNHHFLVDVDGVTFVDYLRGAVDDSDYPLVVDQSTFAEHRRQIEKNLKKYESQPLIWSKYQWVANYHNFFLKRVAPGCTQHIESLFIPDELSRHEPITFAEKYPRSARAKDAGH
jgi:hypothetical protein